MPGPVDQFIPYNPFGSMNTKGQRAMVPVLTNVPEAVMPPPGLGQRDLYNPAGPGVQRTLEQLLDQFPADFVIPAGAPLILDLTRIVTNCTNVVFLDVVGTGIQVNINGGGWRSVRPGTAYEGIIATTLQVQTIDAVSSCIVQIGGFSQQGGA